MAMWIGYAKAGKEFDVQLDIKAMGMDAWVARKMEAIRSGKSRWPEAVTTALLPNYVFITCDNEQWHRLPSVKHLARTLYPVTQIPPDLRQFMAKVDGDYDAQKARVAAGERLSEYEDGDTFEVLSGPLRENFATFREIVETSHDLFPRLRGEVELMGRVVRVEVDPLDARRVG